MKRVFKFTKRKGRNIEVCFSFAPRNWISTGTTDKNEALKFALKKIQEQENKQETLFSSYLKNLTDDNFQRLKNRNVAFGKTLKNVYYEDLTYISKTFLLPLFGHFILQKITFKNLEDKLFKIDESNLTKNRIINTLKVVFNLAISENLIDASPADRLKPFYYKAEESEIFTKEELESLFQEENFSSRLWFLYFSILKDTGWRPSEVASLKYKDINHTGGLSTSSSVVYNGKMAILKNGIKTSNHGQDYKIGLLSFSSLRLFLEISKDREEDEFIFKFNDKFLLTQTANRELKKALKRANIEDKGRTQYSFRHTFNTKYYYTLDDKTRLELMGHTHERKEYLHLSKEERLKHLMKDKNTLDLLRT